MLHFPGFRWSDEIGKGFRLREMYWRTSEARWLICACGFRERQQW